MYSDRSVEGSHDEMCIWESDDRREQEVVQDEMLILINTYMFMNGVCAMLEDVYENNINYIIFLPFHFKVVMILHIRCFVHMIYGRSH